MLQAHHPGIEQFASVLFRHAEEGSYVALRAFETFKMPMGLLDAPEFERMERCTTKKTAASYLPEVRQRAVRLVLEGGGDRPTQRGAISPVPARLGCTADTLRKRVRQAERDGRHRPGPTGAERDSIKALERENRELLAGIRGRADLQGAAGPLRWLSTCCAGATLATAAPSTEHAHAAWRADPGGLSARARSDAALMAEIRLPAGPRQPPSRAPRPNAPWVRARHAEAIAIYRRDLATFKADKTGNVPEPRYPKLDRYMIEGTTVETLSDILRMGDDAKMCAPANPRMHAVLATRRSASWPTANGSALTLPRILDATAGCSKSRRTLQMTSSLSRM